MKSKRHTPEQVVIKLAEEDELLNEGATVAVGHGADSVRARMDRTQESLAYGNANTLRRRRRC